MKYTKDENKKIKKAYEIVISDLNKIWQQCDEKQILIPIPLDLSGILNSKYSVTSIGWNLVLTNQKIILVNRFYNWQPDIVMANSSIKRTFNPCCKNIEIIANFVEAYPKIREKVINKIEYTAKEKENQKNAGFQRKKEQLENIRKITQTYDKEASIEIDLPKTQNQHQLVVTEEEGRTIGTLDFGGRTIKVITDGDIVLVRKSKKEQIKLKQK